MVSFIHLSMQIISGRELYAVIHIFSLKLKSKFYHKNISPLFSVPQDNCVQTKAQIFEHECCSETLFMLFGR